MNKNTLRAVVADMHDDRPRDKKRLPLQLEFTEADQLIADDADGADDSPSEWASLWLETFTKIAWCVSWQQTFTDISADILRLAWADAQDNSRRWADTRHSDSSTKWQWLEYETCAEATRKTATPAPAWNGEWSDIDEEPTRQEIQDSRHSGTNLNRRAEAELTRWTQTLPVEDQIEIELLREETTRISPGRKQRYAFPCSNFKRGPQTTVRHADVIRGDGRTRKFSAKIATILRAKIRDPKCNLTALAREIGYRSDEARKVWARFKDAVEKFRADMRAVGFAALPEDGDDANLRELRRRLLERWGNDEAPLEIGGKRAPRREGAE